MATKTPDLCRIRIGFYSLLLPADKGLKVMALLQGALGCTEKYDTGAHVETYEIDEPVPLELTMVRANQVRRKVEPADRPPVIHAIGTEPLKLTYRGS
ncbi:MAG: hypothetical protein KF740_19900 [Ramlibacter sp.]|nr:hypothetical protein [Ramlibacter sp.]